MCKNRQCDLKNDMCKNGCLSYSICNTFFFVNQMKLMSMIIIMSMCAATDENIVETIVLY